MTSEVARILTIQAGRAGPCPVCNEQTWQGDDPVEWLDQQTNHMLGVHGWQLLHVGQQTGSHVDDGSSWHSTVAVVGEPST